MVTFCLTLIYFWGTLVDGDVYNATRSEWNDLEPEFAMVVPTGVPDPYLYNPDYEPLIGFLYAGELEFTWIVDITSNLSEFAYFSVGNLISYDRVLTACRLFRLMEKKAIELSHLKVQYCMRHTQEKPLQPIDSLGNLLSTSDMLTGSRNVIKVWHHPECIPTAHEHDLSLMQIDKKINPYNPLLCFAPIPIDKFTAHILDQDLSTMNNYKLVCHVASFGREYVNDVKTITQGYKTKVRAYYVPWDKCLDAWDKICHKSELACDTKTAKPVEIMCFGTRAKVGSVCDHDRGAPLVCQGEIMGIVERGAVYSYCSSVLHLPFVVTKIRDFGWIFKTELYRENQIFGQLSYDYETIMPANLSREHDNPIPHGGKTRHSLEMVLLVVILAFFFLT